MCAKQVKTTYASTFQSLEGYFLKGLLTVEQVSTLTKPRPQLLLGKLRTLLLSKLRTLLLGKLRTPLFGKLRTLLLSKLRTLLLGKLRTL